MGDKSENTTIQESLMMSERPPIRSNSLDSFLLPVKPKVKIEDLESQVYLQNTPILISNNNEKYITPSVLDIIFEKGKVNHFDKVKVTTIYLQAPLEIRYFSNPANPGKSWKYAAGVKAGFLFKSYTYKSSPSVSKMVKPHAPFSL